MCVQALGLGFCLSFSVYPLGASAFDRTSTKAGTSPSGESPACLQQEEESPPGVLTRRGRGSLSPPPQNPAPPPGPRWPLGKDMFPGQGLQHPLHFGLELHNGLAGTRVFLWSGQEVGKVKGEGEWWHDRGVRNGPSPGPGLGRESWGSVGGLGDLRRQRHL